MEDVIGELDILYMTRVQKERFFNEADYIRLRILTYWITARWHLPVRTCVSCIRCHE